MNKELSSLGRQLFIFKKLYHFATRPNEKWLADITYIPTAEGWLYLAVVLDLFSRKIVG